MDRRIPVRMAVSIPKINYQQPKEKPGAEEDGAI